MMIQKVKSFIGSVLIILGISLLVYNLIPIKIDKYRKPDSELTTLTAYLINPPQYLQEGGKNKRTFLRLELDQIVGVFFENESEFLEATDWKAVLNEIKYHDTVTIKVLKDRFDKFYVKKSSRSEFQKIINYPIERFNFYSLECKGKEYVADIYIVAEERRRRNLLLQTFVCLLIVATGVWIIRAKK